MNPKVSVKNLVKRYGKVEAVRGVSFEIGEGEIVGLLGPNGAGKTSCLECLIGLREPDGGEVTVCGADALRQPKELRERVGAQLQFSALQDHITPREALHLFGSFYRKRLAPETLLERFSLMEKANARYETLSGGQKQRLGLALALVNDPEFLLLDEPTVGLDPQSRHELHTVIKTFRADGRTVLLTTHYMEEAEQLCDRIVIIDHGVIIAQGTPRELASRSQALANIALSTARPLERERLTGLRAVASVSVGPGGTQIGTSKVGETLMDLLKLLESEQNELLDLQVKKPSLEDVFLELTGRRLRD